MSHVLKSVREPVSSTFSNVKSSIMGLYEKTKKTLTGGEQAEKGREEEEAHREQHEAVEHSKALNGAYRSFRIDG